MRDSIPSPNSAAPTLLRVAKLHKSYTNPVLTDVHLDLLPGEVHALVGENGAGKSTLVRIIAGLTQPDSGSLWLNEKPYSPKNKADAEHHGIRIVLQELNLIANLTVAENIFFDQLPHRLGWINFPRLHAQARQILAQVGLPDIDPARPVKTLGVGQQQLVEIAASLCRPCQILILDEPTAALTDPEIELLFRQIKLLQAKSVGIIYISHRLEEIQKIANRISVLRDGKMVATRPARQFPPDEMVKFMVGRDLDEAIHRSAARQSTGAVALRVHNLQRLPVVRGVTFEARRGEILGFAGLMGSGRTETMRAIFAADKPGSGQIFLHGSARPIRLRSPRDAVRHGIALLTEDRKQQGLLLPLSVRANVTLLSLNRLARFGGWIRARHESEQAQHWAKHLSVRAASTEQPVLELSGGNQQKVVIAKWLFRNCDILIFDEPTRGIDVGAKFEIYNLLARLADAGKAIIVVSSDLKELLAICDRIAVMSAGRLAATFTRPDFSEEKIMSAAFSAYTK